MPPRKQPQLRIRRAGRMVHTTVGDLIAYLQEICPNDESVISQARRLLNQSAKPGQNQDQPPRV